MLYRSDSWYHNKQQSDRESNLGKLFFLHFPEYYKLGTEFTEKKKLNINLLLNQGQTNITRST